MKVSSFLSLIEQFSTDQKKELAQLSGLITDLYAIYGENLSQDAMISEIKLIHPDAGSYIELIHSSIGLHHCSDLHKQLKLEDNSLLCSYHSTDSSLLDHLSKIQQGSITAEWNNEIGVKIQSSGGKSYERTIEKDIENLVR